MHPCMTIESLVLLLNANSKFFQAAGAGPWGRYTQEIYWAVAGPYTISRDPPPSVSTQLNCRGDRCSISMLY